MRPRESCRYAHRDRTITSKEPTGVLVFALALILPFRAAGGRVARVIGGLLLGACLAETAVYASASANGGVASIQWLGALLTLAVGAVLTLASVRARSGT